MSKNKEMTVEKVKLAAPEEVQAEVDDLYNELERRFGSGFADSIIRRYTDIKPRQWSEG